MKVYLFSDYLKTIRGEPFKESQLICEIGAVDGMPDGLVRIAGKLARFCMKSGEDYACIEFMGKLPKQDEISFSENITCPHCGNENGDSWEASDNDDECYCENCGSVFSYERDITVTYSSKIIERNDKVLSLE